MFFYELICLATKEKIYQNYILIVDIDLIGYYFIIVNLNLCYRYHGHHIINYSFSFYRKGLADCILDFFLFRRVGGRRCARRVQNSKVAWSRILEMLLEGRQK
jgi:hypothetical protein